MDIKWVNVYCVYLKIFNFTHFCIFFYLVFLKYIYSLDKSKTKELKLPRKTNFNVTFIRLAFAKCRGKIRPRDGAHCLNSEACLPANGQFKNWTCQKKKKIVIMPNTMACLGAYLKANTLKGGGKLISSSKHCKMTAGLWWMLTAPLQHVKAVFIDVTVNEKEALSGAPCRRRQEACGLPGGSRRLHPHRAGPLDNRSGQREVVALISFPFCPPAFSHYGWSSFTLQWLDRGWEQIRPQRRFATEKRPWS